MGGASFQLASNSPADAALAGKLQGGTFNGGPGEISLAIAIGTTDPIVLPLVHARARATSISDTGISVIVGGLLSIDDLRSSVGEALQKSVTAYLAANCTNQTPPGCGCSGLAGDVITLLDGSTGTPADCKVSVDELLGNPVVGPLLSADSCSTNSCTAPDSISVGIKLDAVPATF
jgi:hypothetical protein